MNQAWHLKLLGGLRAVSGERSIERFRTQKTAALLALLAIRGTQNRERICALLWPDAPPEAARNSLSAALSALRRELGDDIIRADRNNVSLAPHSFSTDLDAFDAALKAGDYATAIELYGGHLLPGYYEDPFPALSGEYEEKARGAIIARLEELESEPTINVERLRTVARRAIALFGDDERWYLSLMRAHYAAGDFDAALRAYDGLGRFARKNGETAGETARALAKTIRREKEKAQLVPATPLPIKRKNTVFETSKPEVADSSRPVNTNLPPQWTRFFGREIERELLHKWIDGGQRFITLSGAGGSGKTRLAIETLRDLLSDWQGGVYFVPLVSITDADLLHATIRDALGLVASADASPLDQLERVLRGQRMVMLLDNFEQLVNGGAARLQALREKLPDVTFLVTSRVLLQLPGEREFPVAPLPTPLRNTNLSAVQHCASAELFCDRASLVLDANNAEAIGALCRRLDGIPLALELAAARARVLSPAQILERLEKHPDFLQSRELGIPPRHKTLRAAIEWSTDLLTPEQRAFFARLSLFRGGFSLEAAESIATEGICEGWETLDLLTQLRECSLIFIEERAGNSRFRMLETLREFGRELLQTEERERTERAFFDYFLPLAQQAASAMQGPEQTIWLDRLDIEGDNLRAALHWAKENAPERGLLLATALIDFWETRLSLDEGRQWIETFLRATEPAPKKSANIETTPASLEVRARAFSGAGRLAWYASDMTGANVLMGQGLETAREADAPSALVYATRSMSRLSVVSGEAEQARDLAKEAVRLSRELGDEAALLEPLNDLGFAELNASDFEASRSTCLESADLARKLGDEHSLTLALNTAAIASYQLGRFEEGKSLLIESVAVATRVGAQFELMTCYALRGRILDAQGYYVEGQKSFREALTICRSGSLYGWSFLNIVLSMSYGFFARGDAEGAVQLMGAHDALAEATNYKLLPFMVWENEQNRTKAREILGDETFESNLLKGRALSAEQAVEFALSPDLTSLESSAEMRALRARAMSGAGRLAWYASNIDEANALMERGFEAAKAAGELTSLIYATRSLARAAALAGDAVQSRKLGREAVQLSREVNDKSLLLESLIDLAFADFNDGDFESTRQNCEAAIALAREAGDEHAQALSLVTLASVAERELKYQEALDLTDNSQALCRRLGANWELMVCLAVRGSTFSKLGEHERAQMAFAESMTISLNGFANSWSVVNTLFTIANAYMRRGDVREAVALMAAAEALRETIGYKMMSFLAIENEGFRTLARTELGEGEFEREWQRGSRMTADEAIERIINPVASDSSWMATRSRALSGAGRLAWHHSDFVASRGLVNQGLKAARDSGDLSSFVYAVAAFVLFAVTTGDIEGIMAEAKKLSAEAVVRTREAGDKNLLLEAILAKMYAFVAADEFKGLLPLNEEAVQLARELRDDARLATALTSTGTFFYYEGDNEAARVLLEECVTICRRLDSPFSLYAALWATSNVAREQKQYDVAQEAILENIRMCRGNPAFRWGVANSLLTLSYLLVEQGDVESAVRLMGAVEALTRAVGYQLVPSLRFDADHYRALAHKKLGEKNFEVAWAQGMKLNPDETIEFALDPEVRARTALMATRSRALSGAGRLAWHHSDFKKSRDLVNEGLQTARESGDVSSFVYAVAAFVRFAMTTGDVEGDITRSRVLSEEAVRLSREADDKPLLVEALISYGYACTILDDLTTSLSVNNEAIDLARELGDEGRMVTAMINFASVHIQLGDYLTATKIAQECVPISRRLGATWDLIASLWISSHAHRDLGNLDVAEEHVRETLELCQANPAFKWGNANVLLAMAYLMIRRDNASKAAQLMGASQAIFDSVGYHLVPNLVPEYERYCDEAKQQLGDEAWQKAFDDGYSMDVERAVEFALEK